MTCGRCVEAVERALLSVEGVLSASADLASQSASVRFDPSSTSLDALGSAAAKAGYSPRRPAGPPGGAFVGLDSIAAPSPPAASGPAKRQRRKRGSGNPAEERWLSVQGMTCASCVRSVEGAATEVAGVESCEANLAEGSARVVLRGGDQCLERVANAIRAAGYDAVAARPDELGAETEAPDGRLARRLAVASALTVPLLILAMSHGALSFSGQAWLQMALALPVLLYSGAPVYSAAWHAGRRGRADMNTLIALGTGAAFAYSLATTVYSTWTGRGGPTEVYFETAAAIIWLVLLGRVLEARARRRTTASIRKLAELQARTVRLRRHGAEVEVPPDEVRVGDVVLVRPGERIPVDGTVVEGTSSVDESAVTGESVPADKAPGEAVTSGALNLDGFLAFRAKRVGAETSLARIITFVRRAQASKAPAERLADRIASVFVPVILAVAAVTFAAWMVAVPGPDSVTAALTAAVSVLVISCPCALGLATPAALAVGIGRAADHGILIRDGEALEATRGLDTVVFDKTGTLTYGRFEVTDIEAFRGVSQAELVEHASAIERLSEHPVARALAGLGSGTGPVPEDYRALPGAGARARVNGDLWTIGKPSLIRDAGCDSRAADSLLRQLQEEGKTVVLAARNRSLAGAFGLRDALRPESGPAVRALGQRGIKTLLVSGDNAASSGATGRLAGIQEVLSEALPLEKALAIERLQAEGRTVAMVGDGINDAPALARADVGIAIGAGADIAAESAGIVLVRSNPLDVDRAVEISRRIHRTIRQNYCWAFGYNLLVVPVAAGVLYPWTGWLLSPIMASAAMALSSLSVLSNSLRLRRL